MQKCKKSQIKFPNSCPQYRNAKPGFIAAFLFPSEGQAYEGWDGWYGGTNGG